MPPCETGRELLDSYLFFCGELPSSRLARLPPRVATAVQLVRSEYGVRQHYFGPVERQADLDRFWFQRCEARRVTCSRACVRFLIAWTRRERFEDSLDEEARFHLDAYTEDLVRSGMSRREAVRRVRIHFGSVEGMKDDCRQARGLRFADQLERDMKHAGRFLRRNPGFAAVAAATLGLSIAATVVVFSIMDAWLFRPLNFPEPDRLTISVYATRERPSEPAVFVLYRDYLSWKERSRSFESMSAVFPRTYLMGDVADVASAAGLVVTGEFFSTLGCRRGWAGRFPRRISRLVQQLRC